MNTSRRAFLKTGVAGIAISSFPSVLKAYNTKILSVENKFSDRLNLGLASYTFREFGLDETIAMTSRLGLRHIALKSFHMPLESTMDEIKAAAAKVREAELDLYGCSVVVLKNKVETNQVFEYAKNAGMRMIIGQPVPELLELINKKVEEYDIKFAIHNHGPEDHNFPSPLETYEKIKILDPRIGLCIDVGHTKRSGFDPADCIRKCADRLLDIHMQDLFAFGHVTDVCEVGRGKLDIPGILRALLEIKFSGIVSFEYIKDPKDPLAGVAESVGFVKGILSIL